MFIGCMCFNLMGKIKVERKIFIFFIIFYFVIFVVVEVYIVIIMFELVF